MDRAHRTDPGAQALQPLLQDRDGLGAHRGRFQATAGGPGMSAERRDRSTRVGPPPLAWNRGTPGGLAPWAGHRRNR